MKILKPIRNFLSFLSISVCLTSVSKATTLSTANLDFLNQILGSSRLDEGLRCTITTRKFQKVRKFMDQSRWVEYLSVSLTTDILGPRDTSISLTPGLQTTNKTILFSGYGPVEEISIKLQDRNSTWLRLIHNGSTVLDFEIGSIYGIYPCKALDYKPTAK